MPGYWKRRSEIEPMNKAFADRCLAAAHLSVVQVLKIKPLARQVNRSYNQLSARAIQME